MEEKYCGIRDDDKSLSNPPRPGGDDQGQCLHGVRIDRLDYSIKQISQLLVLLNPR